MRDESDLYKEKIELELDTRQVFTLFFGGAVLVSLVFMLGLLVGRRVEARSNLNAQLATDDPLAALDKLARKSPAAVQPPVAPPQAKEAPKSESAKSTPPAASVPKKEKSTQAPKKITKQVASSVTPPAGSRFTLHISSFSTAKEANALADKVKAAGYSSARVSVFDDPEKGTKHRVRVGFYKQYEQAIEAKKAFEDSQHVIAYVVRL